jgi:hypothetical protein
VYALRIRSIILKSIDTDLDESRVSVLLLANPDLSKSGEENTITSFSSTDAFGNFFISDNLYDPVSIFVEKLLFKDFRRIPATLFCNIKEIENRTISTEKNSIDVILKIFAASFIYRNEKSFPQKY